MKLTAESTVFNDDKVQSKFAELIVDADGIRTEVGKKVGNTEVISRINQSAESVKIQADKINIDGVITAVNDNTTTTIDGDKITTGTLLASAVKADSGTFNTANIPSLSSEKITVGAQSLTTALNGKAASGAENTANNYITDINNTGIYISPANQSPTSSATGNSVKIDGTGMEVYKDGISVAKYGDSARIGKADNGRVEVSNSAIDLYSGNTKACTVSEYTSGTGKITVYGVNNTGVNILPAGVELFDPSDTSENGFLYSNYLRLGGTSDANGIKLAKSSSNRSLVITAPDGITATSGNLSTKAITAKSITLDGHSSAVGSILSAYLTANKAISAGTEASLCNIQLTAGVWVIVAVAQFPNGSDTTYRRLKISTSSTSAEPPDVQISAHSGHPTTIQSTKIVSISSTTNYYLTVMSAKAHTMLAGSVDGFNYIKAVRIV